MNERKKLRSELLKTTFFNFILYAIIFSFFASVLYIQVNYYMYSSVDSDLKNAKTEWIATKEKNALGNIDRGFWLSNLRVIVIERDEEGEISANSSINEAYLEIFSDISFDDEDLNQIYELSVNGKYYYRAMNVSYTSDTTGETSYAQFLVSVNSEKSMMNVFTTTLVIGFIVIIILILALTYILTKKAIDPIVKNYEKQTEFVQNASHELRTPLTIIQAKQEMLLQSPNSKIMDKSEDIALTLNETRRITKLVKELMDLARADASKEELNKTQTDINQLITEVASPYIEMSELQNKKFTLELNCVKECKVDQNKMRQLMVILMDNALKYTEENDIITIATRNQDDKVFIEVKDTGIGISDEGLKHVFERFYREDKARSREKGGSGLGLSIAKTIVDMHGGTIKMTHNKPKGSIVIIKL